MRAVCSVCRDVESMEHILTECDASGGQVIWRLTRALWEHKHPVWPTPWPGTVLGCGLANFTTDDDEHLTGASHLYRISEAAHLIWKIRCERRIEFEDDESRFHTTTKSIP